MNGGAVPQSSLPNRCVIWHPPGATVRGPLLGDLARYNVQISAITDSEFAAFAQVAVDVRGIHEQRVGGSMLVIVDPSRLRAATEVLRLTRAHGMRTVVWSYDADSATPLQRFEEPKPPIDDAQPKPASGSVPPAASPAVIPNPAGAMRIPLGPPKLRLAGEDAAEPTPTRPRASSILSDAEMAMLLSDEP